MRRELTEEVAIECGWTEHFLGFINDDRTPVGSVHLGVVHVFELNEPRVNAREDGAGRRRLRTRWPNWLAEADEFETWSQFVLEELAHGV